jgi:hypothetical protein
MQAIAINTLKLLLKPLSQFWAKLEQSFNQVPIKLVGTLMVIMLLGACSSSTSEISSAPKPNLSAVKLTQSPKITISEVSPPSTIQKLSRYFDAYEPQVKIIEPKPDQILTDTKVTVKFEVKDLPIFKNPELGLGTHIHVILDNQEYKASYDLSTPLVFENLTAGTHTIRAFASRPWHESFKNEGAFAQSTFHIYTKTGENTPSPQLPLLTYSRPVGAYGAEPVMLDFYLQNTPLHAALLEASPTTDWQIRVSVNNQSFTVDQWLPVYIKGLNPGLNVVKLEFLDSEGHLVPNQFNSTAHFINYQPNGTDTLSRLVRGEAIAGIERIVNPNYVPEAVTTPAPKHNIEEPKVPEAIRPKVEANKIEIKPEPKVETKPEPIKPLELSTPIATPEIPKDIKEIPIAPTLKISEPQPDSQPAIPQNLNKTTEAPITLPQKSNPIPLIEVPKPELIAPNKTTESIVEPEVKTVQTEITPEPLDLKSSPKLLPKSLKGLESLNLGERLKQARQKKVDLDNAPKPEQDVPPATKVD